MRYEWGKMVAACMFKLLAEVAPNIRATYRAILD
jgi:hypothetical protein